MKTRAKDITNSARNTPAEYISQFPVAVQKKLKVLRATIKKSAPQATESMSYGMPAYKLEGPVVYFAAYKWHIGFYPTPEGVAAFAKETSRYKTSKGAIQFPLDEPIPVGLVARIVKFKVKVNLAKRKKSP